MRALALKHQGWSQRAIAEALGVSKPAVSQWLAAVEEGGPAALLSHPVPGRDGRLTAAQKRLIVVRPRNRTTETAIFCQSYHCDRCMLIHCCSNSLGVKYPSAE